VGRAGHEPSGGTNLAYGKVFSTGEAATPSPQGMVDHAVQVPGWPRSRRKDTVSRPAPPPRFPRGLLRSGFAEGGHSCRFAARRSASAPCPGVRVGLWPPPKLTYGIAPARPQAACRLHEPFPAARVAPGFPRGPRSLPQPSPRSRRRGTPRSGPWRSPGRSRPTVPRCHVRVARPTEPRRALPRLGPSAPGPQPGSSASSTPRGARYPSSPTAGCQPAATAVGSWPVFRRHGGAGPAPGPRAPSQVGRAPAPYQ